MSNALFTFLWVLLIYVFPSFRFSSPFFNFYKVSSESKCTCHQISEQMNMHYRHFRGIVRRNVVICLQHTDNLGEHRFADGREGEAVVTRWVVDCL